MFQGGLGRFCLSSLSFCFYLPFGVFKFRLVKLSEGVVELNEGDHSCAPLRTEEPQHNQRNTFRKWKQRMRSKRKWRWRWTSRSRWDTCVFVSFVSATHCSLLVICFKQDDQRPCLALPRQRQRQGTRITSGTVRAARVKLLLVSLPFASYVASLFLCLFAGLLVSWLLVLLVAGSLGRPR